MESRDKSMLVYIGGIEHNGSTLLGVILDQLDTTICVGELSQVPETAWIDKNDAYCGCGESLKKCAFWSNVRSYWEQQTGSDIYTLRKMFNKFDRNRAYYSNFICSFLKTNNYRKYQALSDKLLSSIAIISGNKTIIDTSKRVSRALVQSFNKNIDLRVIHLIRDARGMVYSRGKRKGNHGWLQSVIRWNWVNGLFLKLEKHLGPEQFLRVKYEDLISNPKETVRLMEGFLDLDLSDVTEKLVNKDTLTIGHLAVGNRFINSTNEIRIKSRDVWREELPQDLQETVWRHSQRLMKKLGYEK